MSSILKVNTIRPESGTSITIGADGEAVVNNSPSLTRQGTSANPITFTVTVAPKTSANVYDGAGSSNAYFIDGQEAPSILVEGNESSSYEYYYRFDQSDASNSGHPLVFYLDASKSQSFNSNVTTNGTPGSAGAYTQIKVGGGTPHVLYYQCSSHALMGNKLINPATRTFNSGGVGIKLPTGSPLTDQIFKVSGVSNGIAELTYGSAVTFPTISSISPSVTDNTQTAITITGTNFQSIPFVDAINSSTGAIITADSVAFTSATTIVATFTISVDGTYFLRVENNDGLSVRSGSALLTVSDAPAWQTAAGSLGTFSATASFGTITLTATDSTSMSLQSGSFPGGMTLNSGAGSSTLTGIESGSTQTTTYTFTIRATDAEGQTSDRQFTITISHGATGGAQFN